MEPQSSTEQTVRFTTGFDPGPWREVAGRAVTEYRAIQDANELAVALALANSIAPRTILEIGSYAGGTIWAWAQLPTVQTIVTVDRDPESDAYEVITGLRQQIFHITRDSRDPGTVADLASILVHAPVDLLFIDGSHDYDTVDSDWRTYGPMVRTGGLVMFHDTQPHDGRPEVEVHRLWADIRRAYSTAEIVANPGTWAGIGIVWK